MQLNSCSDVKYHLKLTLICNMQNTLLAVWTPQLSQDLIKLGYLRLKVPVGGERVDIVHEEDGLPDETEVSTI